MNSEEYSSKSEWIVKNIQDRVNEFWRIVRGEITKDLRIIHLTLQLFFPLDNLF